ncbi:MAG TPA: outer membrane protein transport protein [Elusimicrobiota bacterium]|nr:outer membrane protein transport protein [Elusimicrobiota bacterium]
MNTKEGWFRMKTNQWRAAGLFFVLAFPVAVEAETYLGVRELGDPVVGVGARSLSMGGTGVARGGRACTLAINPAVMNDFDRSRLSMSAGPVFMTEKAAETASTTRFRNSNYLEINELGAAFPLGESRFRFGLALTPITDFHYKMTSSIYAASGAPTKTTELKDSGVVWALSPAISFGFGDNFSLGLSYNYWTGSEDASVNLKSVSSGVLWDISESATYGGSALRLGFRLKASERFQWGGYYQPSSKMTRNYSFTNSTATAMNKSSQDTFDFPSSVGIGFSCYVPSEHNTEFSMEIHQSKWSQVKVNGAPVNTVSAIKPIFQEVANQSPNLLGYGNATPRNYRDVTEVRAGIEHELAPQMFLRYGFHYLPCYSDQTIEATYFTVGFGTQISEKVGWDLAGEFGKRDYTGDNLYYSATKRVDESHRKILLSGFVKW